jgi:apolipoprotein N-acyltransferase
MFRLLASFFLGSLAVLGFAPFDWWPIVFFSLVGFLLLILSSFHKNIFLLGLFYGLGYFGFGVGWIQVSIHQFGISSYFFSYGATTLLVIFLSSYIGLFAVLLRLLANNGFHIAIASSVLWLAMEYFRGYLFTGFPWLSLGYSQIDGPLGGYIPIIGSMGCSFLVVLVSCLVVTCAREGRLPSIYRLCVLAGIFCLGILLRFHDITESRGSSLDVTLVQGAIPQEIKWHPNIRQPSIDRYRSISADHWDSDIIIWPETAIPAFRNEVGEELRELSSLASETDTNFLLGIPRISAESGLKYNSIVSVGDSEQVYDKRHLVPFGEYLPAVPYLSRLLDYLDIPMSDFSSGSPSQALLEFPNYKIGVSICYESVFPALINQNASESNFLVNLSNDAWFGDSLGPHQHLQIARTRALETGRYLVRATNNGLTAIINHKGNVLEQATQFVPTYLRGHVQPKTGSTLYVRFGDRPLICLAAFLFVINFFFRSYLGSYRSRSHP